MACACAMEPWIPAWSEGPWSGRSSHHPAPWQRPGLGQLKPSQGMFRRNLGDSTSQALFSKGCLDAATLLGFFGRES